MQSLEGSPVSSPGSALLCWIIGEELLQGSGLLGKGGPCCPPRLEELLLPGDDKATLARLEVDHKAP
jgi:hypothetical protein